jgi:hypothetical protein
MEVSFKSIKEKLVQRLSNKFTQKQVEEAFDVAQANLVNAYQEMKKDEESALNEYMATDNYAKMKKLSYWIFNNYGIPEDNKCVFHLPIYAGLILSEDTKNRDQIESNLKSNIYYKAYKNIINQYLNEYTEGHISFSDDLFSPENLAKPSSLFRMIEKELYPDYNYPSDYYKSDYSDTQSNFIRFKALKDIAANDNSENIIRIAEDKIKSYLSTSKNKPKLIIPFSGLVFDSINKLKIAEDAEHWNLSKEELLAEVKSSIETVKANGFLTVGCVYQSELLLSFVLFRRVWYMLNTDNEIVIAHILNQSLNNLSSYYGSGAKEILEKAQQEAQ